MNRSGKENNAALQPSKIPALGQKTANSSASCSTSSTRQSAIASSTQNAFPSRIPRLSSRREGARFQSPMSAASSTSRLNQPITISTRSQSRNSSNQQDTSNPDTDHNIPLPVLSPFACKAMYPFYSKAVMYAGPDSLWLAQREGGLLVITPSTLLPATLPEIMDSSFQTYSRNRQSPAVSSLSRSSPTSSYRSSATTERHIVSERKYGIRIKPRSNAKFIHTLEYHPQSTSVFAASTQGTILIYDASEKAKIHFKTELIHHKEPVYAMLVNQNHLLVAAADRQISVWDLSPLTVFNSSSVRLPILLHVWNNAHQHRIRSLVAHNQLLYSSGDDMKIHIWRIDDYRPLGSWDFPAPVYSMHVTTSDDTKMAWLWIGMANGSLLVYDISLLSTQSSASSVGQPIMIFSDKPHKSEISSVKTINKNIVASTGFDGCIQLFYHGVQPPVRYNPPPHNTFDQRLSFPIFASAPVPEQSKTPKKGNLNESFSFKPSHLWTTGIKAGLILWEYDMLALDDDDDDDDDEVDVEEQLEENTDRNKSEQVSFTDPGYSTDRLTAPNVDLSALKASKIYTNATKADSNCKMLVVEPDTVLLTREDVQDSLITDRYPVSANQANSNVVVDSLPVIVKQMSTQGSSSQLMSESKSKERELEEQEKSNRLRELENELRRLFAEQSKMKEVKVVLERKDEQKEDRARRMLNDLEIMGQKIRSLEMEKDDLISLMIEADALAKQVCANDESVRAQWLTGGARQAEEKTKTEIERVRTGAGTGAGTATTGGSESASKGLTLSNSDFGAGQVQEAGYVSPETSVKQISRKVEKFTDGALTLILLCLATPVIWLISQCLGFSPGFRMGPL